MKGKLIYAAATATTALLVVFEDFFFFSLIFLLICLGLYIMKKVTIRQLSGLLLLFVFFIMVGIHAESVQKTGYSGTETSFRVRFIDDIAVDGDRFSAIAVTLPKGEKVIVNHRVQSFQEKEALRQTVFPGTTCELTGRLSLPGQARNPNSFDYLQYLKRKNIFWIIEPDTIDQNLCSQKTGNLITTLKKFRQTEIHSFTQKLNDETAAVFAALLFGDRQLMSPETEDSYAKTGIVHLLAISGLHVALLSGMCFYLFLLLGLTREQAQLVLIMALPMYAVLTGLAPPVNRAVTMLLFFLIAKRYQFKISALDVISISFMLLLLPNPFLIYEPGFQLSFAVSFTLVLSARGIFHRYQSYLASMTSVSFASQLVSIPILLTYFYEFPLVSVFANLLFVPLFSFVILPIILATYLLQLFFPFTLNFLLLIVDPLISFTNLLSSSLSSLPFVSLTLGKPSLLLIILYLLTTFFVFIRWENDTCRKMPHAVIVLPLIPIIIQLVAPSFMPYGKVAFLDVGQGDSIVIQLPFRQGTYLIDTGGRLSFNKEEWQEKRDSFEVGQDILVPYLKSEGIRKIDKLILTHGDVDHIGGAKAVLSEFKLKELILPFTLERAEMEQEIIEIARKKAVKVSIVGMGEGWRIGEHKFQVVGPMEKLEDRNEGSIVLWASFGGKTWLFTGDLGKSGEEQLVKKFPDMSVDVLKVGHHGSRTSSSENFIDHVSPKIAVISAGVGNRYGHPHSEVIGLLEKSKVKILRTDADGAIIYTFKGKSGTFRTSLP